MKELVVATLNKALFEWCSFQLLYVRKNTNNTAFLVQNPQNVNLVVDIAVEYTDAMGGWQKVLDVMERAPNASQMEFAYLARRIATSEEPEEHYRYIVAAAKCQQFQVCYSVLQLLLL